MDITRSQAHTISFNLIHVGGNPFERTITHGSIIQGMAAAHSGYQPSTIESHEINSYP